MGPHTHGNAARHVVGDLNAEGSGQQQPSNDPRNHQHNLQCANYWGPLTRKRYHKAAAAVRTQRPDAAREGEERVTVHGPVKKPQLDGMSHRGGWAMGEGRVGRWGVR